LAGFFDSFEEQFDLPSLFIVISNLRCSGGKYVGTYDDILIVFFVYYMESSLDIEIICYGFRQGQTDLLITLQVGIESNRTGAFPVILKVFSGSNNELTASDVDFVQTGEVDVSPIHDVNSPGLNGNLVYDMNKHRFGFVLVQDRMHHNSPFTEMKVCPGKQRQAQFDRRRAQGKDLFGFFQSCLFVTIQVASLFYKYHRQILVHLPGPGGIGIGKGAQRNLVKNPM